MAGKKRFNMDDMMEDVNAYIEKPNEAPAPNQPENTTEQKAEPVQADPKPYSEPDKAFRRNITLSEELFWRLDYIKKRKNKNRGDGSEFVTLDRLMFDMVQYCLDTQYASTKRKFEEHKATEKDDEDEDWI